MKILKSVGVDIGGTKTAVGLFDSEKLVESVAFATGTFQETSSQIIDWARARGPDAIGVGCTGPLDEAAGTVKNDDTLTGWMDAPLVETLRRALGVPVFLVNDADAALLGELWAGSLRDSRSEPALMLTFGTGVGGAFWDGSRLLKGAGGEHPEIGHILVQTGGRPCYCGLSGCLEAEASGASFDVMARESGYEGFAKMAADGAGEEILSYAQERIEAAIRVFAHTFRPASIVFGGGMIARYGEKLIRREVLTPEDAPLLLSPMRVLRAELGLDAGIYGAAALALELFR